MLSIKLLIAKILDSLQVKSAPVSITASTGTLVSATARKYGKVVQLTLGVKNTASVAGGANIFVGVMNTTNMRPILFTSSGAYRGSYAISGGFSATGNIVIRNTDTRAHVSSDTVIISFTYLVN